MTLFPEYVWKVRLLIWFPPVEYVCYVTLLTTFEAQFPHYVYSITLLDYTCARMHTHTYRHAPNLIQDGLFVAHTSIINRIANIPSYTT